MRFDSNRFLDLANRLFTQKGWNPISFPNVDLAIEKRVQTSIVRTVHRLFFININQMEKQHILQIIEEIHQQSTSQPPLFPCVNQIIFLFDKSFDVAWLQNNGKKQDISTSVSTVSWGVDLTSKKLYIHRGRPFLKKGEKEINSIIQQL